MQIYPNEVVEFVSELTMNGTSCLSLEALKGILYLPDI
jgi:hypothetical protein